MTTSVPADGKENQLRPRQFTLRAILLVATIVPPLVGGFCGALGPHVQLWLLLAIGIPVVVLAMMGLAFAIGYVIFALPVILAAKILESLYNRFSSARK